MRSKTYRTLPFSIHSKWIHLFTLRLFAFCITDLMSTSIQVRYFSSRLKSAQLRNRVTPLFHLLYTPGYLFLCHRRERAKGVTRRDEWLIGELFGAPHAPTVELRAAGKRLAWLPSVNNISRRISGERCVRLILT